MTTSSFVLTVLAWTAVTTLGLSGLAHLTAPRQLCGALAEQAILPRALLPFTAGGVILTEIASSASSAVGLLGAGHVALKVGLGLIAGLCLAYGIYAGSLVRIGSTARCGCSSSDYPLSIWVSARAFALAAMALVAVAGAESMAVLLPLRSQVDALAALTSVGLAIVVWILPQAMDGSSIPPAGATQ